MGSPEETFYSARSSFSHLALASEVPGVRVIHVRPDGNEEDEEEKEMMGTTMVLGDSEGGALIWRLEAASGWSGLMRFCGRWKDVRVDVDSQKREREVVRVMLAETVDGGMTMIFSKPNHDVEAGEKPGGLDVELEGLDPLSGKGGEVKMLGFDVELPTNLGAVMEMCRCASVGDGV
ncbi:hypothetical protein JAAARDRAFT_39696 [Jaapia argillacea MUCL 33604]|uniref:Uncharacterized protein n=1 Tax=Jaapia argillacea MUCL 33604 TaxID=933084 RepID=A0A067PDL9_9AGAM|nr:hypothetical protein JAAARDRAFT_39696 [Jaapia argillacea MUCL 33604]